MSETNAHIYHYHYKSVDNITFKDALKNTNTSNKPLFVLFSIHFMLLSSQNIINVSHNNMQVAVLSAPLANIIFEDKSLLLMKMGLFISLA